MHNVQNAMFAAAMAYSIGIKLEHIRQGLRTFDTTFFQAPGRMNVFNEHPFKVMFDYGHNAHAVGAMADLAARLDVHRAPHRACSPAPATAATRTCARSPRRSRAASITTSAVATTTCATARPTRCRGSSRRRCRRAACRRDAISIIPDEQEAIDAALSMGQPGDLLLMFADALTRSWKQIIKFRSATSPVPRAKSPQRG